MVNSQVTAEISNALKIDERVENIPSPIPVIEVGIKRTKNAIIKEAHSSLSGATTIYTTPADMDFYLCSISMSIVKNAACDAATGYIGVYGTINGQTQYLLTSVWITLTAERIDINITFPHSIKIDRNTSIRLGGVFAAGVMERTACITGFIDEVS